MIDWTKESLMHQVRMENRRMAQERCSLKVVNQLTGQSIIVDLYGISYDQMMEISDDGSHAAAAVARRLNARGFTYPEWSSSPFWVKRPAPVPRHMRSRWEY